MADTRTSKAGSVASGDFASYVDVNALPGGLIGKAIVTANQTGITTAQDLANLTLTLTPNSSRILRIEFRMLMALTTASSNDAMHIYILKDGTQILDAEFHFNQATLNQTLTDHVLDIGPTNASHTYKLNATRVSSGTYALNAGATYPAILSIVDYGPSF